MLPSGLPPTQVATIEFDDPSSTSSSPRATRRMESGVASRGRILPPPPAGRVGGCSSYPDDEQLLSNLWTHAVVEAKQQPVLQRHLEGEHRHLRCTEGLMITAPYFWLYFIWELPLP
jgi:hypothetical protein